MCLHLSNFPPISLSYPSSHPHRQIHLISYIQLLFLPTLFKISVPNFYIPRNKIPPQYFIMYTTQWFTYCATHPQFSCSITFTAIQKILFLFFQYFNIPSMYFINFFVSIIQSAPMLLTILHQLLHFSATKKPMLS